MGIPMGRTVPALAGQGGTGAPPYGIAPQGYRLPVATSLGTVRLQVADLARSVAYYEGVLGLRVLDRGQTVARLGAAEARTPLLELHERQGVAPVPRRGRLGLYHFAILLPDRSALGRFVRHLSDIGERAGMSDHFVSEAIYLTDPDGLGIEVYADRPRSAWRHADGQLVMTTVALDVNDLTASAGGPWTGMPAGTVIGHVHLFVDDLERSAAFYHTGLGLDKTVWNYPGALFLAAGGYHHHVGTNTWAAGAVPAGPGDARLLEWELVVPTAADVAEVLASVEQGGARVEHSGEQGLARDPWGTAVRIRPATA
jgi:Predicted ring-cleavage extradiol dioxygenase